MSTETPFYPTDLRCEYLKNPLGVDTPYPRFSWMVNHPQRGQFQTAYQVLVAGDLASLDQEGGDLWDSGKILSAQSLHIVYAGKPLASDATCYWKVRIWDRDGTASNWSEAATFGMGLLRPEDWHSAWIGSPQPVRGVSPIFRKVFQLDKKMTRARVYICGLGYYELRINGQKVGDNVLDPGTTDYSKRALYVTHPIEAYLREGENVIGVMLGEGWLGNDHEAMIQNARRTPEWIGFPCLMLQMNIQYSDGTHTEVVTGNNQGWLVANGPIIGNGIYNGETYDAQLEKMGWDIPGYQAETSEGWVSPVVIPGPKGRLVSQPLEPIKVVQDVLPVRVMNPKPDVYVYDFGQNMAGWVKLKVRGKPGCKVTMKYAELLYDNGLVNQEPLRSALCRDTYILKGEGVEIYQPRFTYHGFRYAQLEGYPGVPDLETLTAKVVRSSVEISGSFNCSNPLLNTIQRNVFWTETSNLHSIPTDCPQREERMGWLNDFTVRVEEVVYNFNVSRLLAKWEDDIEDTQRSDGAIADTAPYVYGSVPADAVCSSYLLIPWFLYVHYGDRRILETHYDGMRRWVEYLGIRANQYIVDYSYYGDWAGPQFASPPNNAISAITPGKLMSTGYYYYNAILLSKIALILGKEEDAKNYKGLAAKIGEAFNNTYLNTANGHYAQGSQASQVFALFLSLVPDTLKPQVIDTLVQDVVKNNNYHLTTGNQCTKYLPEILAEMGHIDVAYRLAAQTTYPSWGYMIEHGATTIWERWELATGKEMNSHSHPMYCTISSWFYKMLAGIIPDADAPGFGSITIKPHIPQDLLFVEAVVKTLRGPVVSSWRKKENGIILQVAVPFNSKACVYVPKLKRGLASARVYESDQLIWQSGLPAGKVDGVQPVKETDEYMVFDVQSGSYSFICY